MQQETNEQMQKMSNNMMQACSDMNNIMRDTVNATLESITIMTKGCNELCNQVSSLMQKNLEQTAKMSQTMMSASSVNDFVDTQNTVMKNSLDNMMAEMTNLSQLSSRIAQQAAEPVTKHVNETMTKLSNKAQQAA